MTNEKRHNSYAVLFLFVMAGLVPAIHVFLLRREKKRVDARPLPSMTNEKWHNSYAVIFLFVMAGLAPAIHVFLKTNVDARLRGLDEG